VNVETFKRIAREALSEVLEERHARESYSWMRWRPAQDSTNIIVFQLCAVLKAGSDEEEPNEGQEDMRVGIDSPMCIENDLTEAEAKQSIKEWLRKADLQ
jgi:hypothetical protein